MLVATLAAVLGASAQAAPAAEYRVKAAFLLNFLHFVEWPPETFANANAPIVICVIGDDPFGDALEQTVEGEAVGQRRIVVRRARTIAEVPPSQLVFISRSEGGRLDDVFAALGSATPVLTVSDIDHFAGRGGIIGFLLDRNRVRFEIDRSAAQRRHLKLSSQLLSLGRIVQ